jgi:dTDP-glucose pyrophosphorylase
MKRYDLRILRITIFFLFLSNASFLNSQDLVISDKDKEELILLSIAHARANKEIIEREENDVDFFSKDEIVIIRFKPKQPPSGVIVGGVYIFTVKKINGTFKIVDFRLYP